MSAGIINPGPRAAIGGIDVEGPGTYGGIGGYLPATAAEVDV